MIALVPRGKKGGGKGGGGGQAARAAREDPNTLRSKRVARVIDLISEGPIVGLVDGAKSIFLDETPLQGSDGGFNFQGVTWVTRDGDPVQEPIPGVPGASSEVVVNTQVQAATPITRTISDTEVDAAVVTIRIPALSEQDTSTGDLHGSTVGIQIFLTPNGGPRWMMRAHSINGKTTSPYEISYRIPMFGDPPWDLEVVRAWPDSDKITLQNDTWWTSYTAIVDAKFEYPDRALVGLTVDAEQFGADVPQRAYEIKGRIIQIPSNYDPETRTYTGIWDGTFTTAWTDNPAWVFYDMLTNERYGLGEHVGAAAVDKWRLYEIAQYCDGLVDDGFGGQEPRLTCNVAINSRQQAHEVINALASVFRGMPYWGNGMVTATQDAPADPVRLVTRANVVDGEFLYEGSALKARHTVALVSWTNPANGYRPSIEVVEDLDGVERFGYREKPVTAYGCTSRGQAHRFGKWALYAEQHETELVSYTAGLDHADVRPGDIISISDETIAGARYGGRVLAATATEVTLDKAPAIGDVTGWSLMVTLPDGGVETRALSALTGDVATVAALSAVPVAGAVWLLTHASVEPRQFRVLANIEDDDHLFKISALEHHPGKYAAIEQGIQFDEQDFTSIPTGPLSTPPSVSVSEYLYRQGPRVAAGMTLSWTHPSDPRVAYYRVDAKGPNEPEFGTVGWPSANSFDLRDARSGSYTFRIYSYDALGRASSGYVEHTHINQGLLAAPASPTNLRVSVNARLATLVWAGVSDLDLSHYEVRFSGVTSGAVWQNMQVLVAEVAPGTTTVVLPARVGTFAVKAVDQSGVYSPQAAFAVSTSLPLLTTNVVADRVEAPGWAGAKTDTEVAAGALRLFEAVNHIPDWDDVSTGGWVALGTSATATPTEVSLPADGDRWAIPITTAITAGDTWYLQLEVRATAGKKMPFSIERNTGGAYESTSGTFVATGEWQTINVEHTFANNHTSLRAGIAPSSDPDRALSIEMRNVQLQDTPIDFPVSTSGVAAGGFPPDGQYEVSSAVDLGGVFPCHVTSDLIASGDNIDNTMSTWTSLASVATLAGTNPTEWGVRAEMRHSDDAVAWTDWTEILASEITARHFEFRLELESENEKVTPNVTDWTVTVDMTDRVERGQDVVAPATGIRIDYSPAFAAKPALAIDGQDMQQGDYYERSNASETGFDLIFRNSSGTAVERTFDWIAAGYGRKQD